MRNVEIISVALFLLGLVLSLVGLLISSMEQILLGVGTSLCSAAIVSFINLRYYHSIFSSEELSSKWGLKAIYEYRAQLNERMNSLIENGAQEIDGIVQGGITSLRQNLQSKLLKKIKDGLEIRLLIPHLDKPIGGAVHTKTEDLISWHRTLPLLIRDKVKIKEYFGVPQDLYFRVDDVIKVGPYLIDRAGSQTITYEFDHNSRGGQYYSNYFDELWEKSKGIEDRDEKQSD